MGRNEEEWLHNKRDWLKRLEEISDSITASDATELTNLTNIGIISLMLSRIADTLEEINEKLDKKTDGGYLVCGDNLRVIHCDTGTDDCK